MTRQKWVRVELVNLRSINTHCGYGEGKTLADAQADALRRARTSDPNARLSDTGWQVWFACAMHC